MPFQEVNGINLYYEDEGVGEPIVLVHGAFNTGRSQFGRMVERLVERGYRVILPDLRGYGRSRPPQRDYPVTFYRRDMEDLAALFAALDTGPVHAVGISDGGVVGLLLAIHHPAQVVSVVAWASNVDFPAEERGLYENLRTAGGSPEYMELMRERHGMNRAEATRFLEDYVQVSLALTDGEGDLDLAERLGEIRCPVLVGAGARGDFLPLRHAQQQARDIPAAELWIEPHVGHFWPMTLDGSEVFVGRILNWIVQHPRRNQS